MTRDQKIVIVGALSGVALMIGALILLSPRMPALTIIADAGDRLAYAAKWVALAAAPLFIAIIAIGNGRFLSEAIDPMAGRESRAMIINGRVADNTLQQFVLFAAASFAVAAGASGDQLGLISAAAILFVICRFAFWIGYRIDPMQRAAGFASTAYLNLTLFGVAMWRAWA